MGIAGGAGPVYVCILVALRREKKIKPSLLRWQTGFAQKNRVGSGLPHRQNGSSPFQEDLGYHFHLFFDREAGGASARDGPPCGGPIEEGHENTSEKDSPKGGGRGSFESVSQVADDSNFPQERRN